MIGRGAKNQLRYWLTVPEFARYKEGELNVGETACIDRCASKYWQVRIGLQENLSRFAAFSAQRLRRLRHVHLCRLRALSDSCWAAKERWANSKRPISAAMNNHVQLVG